MHFKCGHCGSILSSDLSLVNIASRNETMGESFLKAGSVMIEDGSYFRNQIGKYIIHIDDVKNAILTMEPRRLNGCCGLDGLDGPNLLCESCGSYIATKITDCWTPHCVVFELNCRAD